MKIIKSQKAPLFNCPYLHVLKSMKLNQGKISKNNLTLTMSVMCLGNFVVLLWQWGYCCVDVMVKSSAYDIILVLAGVGGVSCM